MMCTVRFLSGVLWLKVLGVFLLNDTATTDIYTLSLHDALPISDGDDIGLVNPVNIEAIHKTNKEYY